LIAGVAGEVVMPEADVPLSADELRSRVRDGFDAVLCMLHDPVDASVLEAARGCRVFANMAVGYNNIDVAAATRLGILVTNTPGVLTEATADLAWALILAVSRRVAEGDRTMRAGAFPGWGPNYMIGGDVTPSGRPASGCRSCIMVDARVPPWMPWAGGCSGSTTSSARATSSASTSRSPPRPPT